MDISDTDSSLCSKHAADRHKELDQADLAAVLVGDIQEFRDAVTINHSLGELYKLQARNKITPRRAAVLAYTANLLLRTLPAIARDNGLQLQQQGPLLDYSDWPDPEDGSGIRGPACYRRAFESGALPDPRKNVVMILYLPSREPVRPSGRDKFRPCRYNGTRRGMRLRMDDGKPADGSDRTGDGAHPGGVVRDGMRNRAR